MNIPPASSLISFETQHKDSENTRISPKFYADLLPIPDKKRNGKHIAKTPIIKSGPVQEKIPLEAPTKTIQERGYPFCVPVKVLEAWEDIEVTAINEIKGYRKSYLLETLTLISLNLRKDEGEARLKSEYVRKIIPNAEKYFKFLIRYGIIKRTSYVPGVTCFSYRFTPEYDSRFKYFPVDDMYLVRRIHKNNLKRHNTHKYPGQSQYLRQMTIEPEALEYIKRLDDKKYNAAIAAILKIMLPNGEGIYFSVDNTSFRAHHNVSNLLEDLRQFIRIAGKPLSNVDIKNSQLYLGISLITDPSKLSPYAKSEELSELLKSLQGIDSMDSAMFVFLASHGKLYEYLWDEYFREGLTYRDDDSKRWLKYPDRESIKDEAIYNKIRKKVKKTVFVILFGRGSYWGKHHEIFEARFPEVYERVTLIKGHSSGSKFESYKRMGILLQTVESHLMLNVIVPRINKVHPGTIAITIHDSIMTSIMTSDVEAVKNIMYEELTGFMGYKPTLKVENRNILTEQKGKEGKREREERENHYPVNSSAMN